VRSVWAAAFLLRRLRSEAGVAVLILILVAVTTFLLAGAPRLFNLVADEGLHTELAEASPVSRNVELSREFVVPTFANPLPVLEQLGTTYKGRFPESVRSLVGEPLLQATTARFGIVDPPNYTTFVSLRYQDGVDDAIRIVDGRLPQATGEPLPPASFVFGPGEGEPPPEEPPRIEIALSEQTAAAIGVQVDDELVGSIDVTDPLVPGTLNYPLEARLQVVGIFAIDDPRAEIWFSDNRLNEISLRGSVDNPIAFATGLIAPEAFADVAAAALPVHYDWRYFLDEDRLDAGRLDELVPDLRRTATLFARRSGGNAGPERISMRSGLVALLERYEAERAASEAVLSIAATGPITLAAGAFAMTAVLLVARRRANLTLARDRGASGRLLLGAQLWEAVLIAGLGAIIGYALAVTLVPGRGSSLSSLLALATGVGAVAVLIAATWPATRRIDQRAGRDEPPGLRASPRRLVLEATAVGLAIAGVALLQQRGLTIGGTGDDGGIVRFDPFLAAVPVLAGIAAAIVAVRLYPLPIGAFGWLAARRRGVVAVLGLRSVARRASFTTLPLLVLMLTAAFGSFASVLMASIDRGQLEASWAGVGADYRLEGHDGSTLTGLDAAVAAVAGVSATAQGYLDASAEYESRPNHPERIRFEALDPVAYETVTEGSPAAPAWPAAIQLTGASDTATLGTPENPIPAIVSTRAPAGSQPLPLDAEFPLETAGQELTLRAVEVRTSFPGIPPGTPFVVTSFPAVQAALDRPPAPNLLFARGDAVAGAALEELVDDEIASGVAISRHAWYADLREAPLIAVVGDGFRLALAVAVAYALLAVIAALTLSASRRTRDVAFLRTLGLSGRQSFGVTVVEHGTPVLVALVPGILIGIAIAALLESSLGLGAFIGPEVPFRIYVDWRGIAIVGGSLIIVVAVAIASSTWLARRTRPVEALRAGEA
jgi:putative ABC transport system permease protein